MLKNITLSVSEKKSLEQLKTKYPSNTVEVKKAKEERVVALKEEQEASATTYAHVPQQGRAKLTDQIVKYVFVGYDLSSKGNKLCKPSNNEVVVSCD